MSGGLIDKVYIGLDNAPAAFDIRGRIMGPVSFFNSINYTVKASRYLVNVLFVLNFSEWHKFRVHTV